MKFPKYRANIYIVMRETMVGSGSKASASVLGAFSDLVEADDFKDACAAEWFDKTKGEPAYFTIRLSTFYG